MPSRHLQWLDEPIVLKLAMGECSIPHPISSFMKFQASPRLLLTVVYVCMCAHACEDVSGVCPLTSVNRVHRNMSVVVIL